MEVKLKYILVGIMIGLVIGGIGGFYLGIDIVIHKIVEILPLFANVSINADAIDNALFRYNSGLGCAVEPIGLKDALIRSD